MSEVTSHIGPGDTKTQSRKRRPEKALYRRIRFVKSELSAAPDARARVRVVLSGGKKRYEAEADGVGGETVVMRLAVEAAIRALHSATDSAGTLQLVGIKLVHAFDGRVVLVCLNSSLWPEAKLLGAVPVRDRLEEAAARAVLAATNRLTERPAPASAANGKAPGPNGTAAAPNGATAAPDGAAAASDGTAPATEENDLVENGGRATE